MKWVIWLVVLLVLSPLVFGLGVSPAKKIIVSPGEVAFTIKDAPSEIAVRVEGPFSEYFQTRIEVVEGVTKVYVTLMTLEGISPGDHEHRIIVSPVNTHDEGFSAVVEIAAVVVIRVPYTGAYLVANAFSEPINASASRVTITVENRGIVDLVPTEVSLLVAGETQVLSSKVIPANGAIQFVEVLSGKGLYDAQFRVDEFSIDFPVAIGRPSIVFFDAQADPDGGTIVPIDIAAQVAWNTPLDAIVHIVNDTYVVTIAGEFSERYYVETSASLIPVSFEISGDLSTVNISLSTLEVERSRFVVWMVLVIIFFVVVSSIFVLYRRKKNS